MTQTVDISLPAGTRSVQGTVNSVVVTWINIEGNTWEAVATRSADDIYVLELTVTEENGLVTNLSAVLFYSGLHLITDRTAEDVARWQELKAKGLAAMTDEERAEWLGDMKGCYSEKDMNRVEGAVKLLADRSSAMGYHFSPAVRMNWTGQDIPTREDMDRYFGNVRELRNLFPALPSTPAAPSTGDRLDYSMANDLEKILLDINQIQTIIAASWCYAGEIYSEEV